jgi:DNA polymerase-1
MSERLFFEDEETKTKRYQDEQVANFLVRVARAMNTTKEAITELGRELAKQPEWFRKSAYKFFRACVDHMRDGPTETLVLIDISQWIHQQWHVTGGTRECIQSCVERVNRMCEREKHVFVAGEGGRSFRHDLVDSFKGDRPSRPPEFKEYEQEILKQLPCPIISYPSFESDDVMAAFALTASIWGHRTILETTDKDTWQALSPLVVSRHKGELFTRDKLMEKHSIRPDQSIDWLCLVGKNNIPGCKGIGEKKASEYLSQYGNVETIIAELPRTPKLGEALDDFATRYETLRKIHTYNKFLPITIDLRKGSS